MGMAKAAELNGEPGPKHVLDLAGQLGLTETQRRDVQAIFDRMSAVAKPLGGQLIAQGQALDQLFAKGEITPDRLTVGDGRHCRASRSPARRASLGTSRNAGAAEPGSDCPLRTAPGLRRSAGPGTTSSAPWITRVDILHLVVHAPRRETALAAYGPQEKDDRLGWNEKNQLVPSLLGVSRSRGHR